ncbi:MAG: DUF3788 family protein [Planctomycetes bacterium]|nr:DUF3788 family protein [Planctomycetota bacterium]MBI3846355.1 DUF3788 family protein [Planctomycetota bacterium]
MAPSAFLEKGSPPDDRDLEQVLGKASALWDALRDRLAAEFAPLDEKWSYSGKSHGWLLRLTQKKKTVVYLIPCAGTVVASFALREDAGASARASRLPKTVLDLIDRAPKFAEGRAVRIDVRSKKDLEIVVALAAINMAN